MELYVTDDARLFVVLPFMASIFVLFVSRLALYGELRRSAPGVSLYLSMAFPYLEYQYLRRRSAIASRRLDLWFVTMVGSTLCAVLSAVYLWRVLVGST